MKHYLYLLCFLLVGCFSGQEIVPPFVSGELDKPFEELIAVDSIQFVSPAVEMSFYERKGESIIDCTKRDEMRNRIIDFQNSLFPSVPFHKLDIVIINCKNKTTMDQTNTSFEVRMRTLYKER